MTQQANIQKGNVNSNQDVMHQYQVWGGYKIGEDKEMTRVNWSEEETNMHINLNFSVWLTNKILTLCWNTKQCDFKVSSDNTTAVAYQYLNNMDGTKTKYNDIAKKIWLWCYTNNNGITAAR